MLVISFIVVFIVGAITGVAVVTLLGSHVTNMTIDEMNQCGDMIIKAGNNRESVLELTIDNDSGFDHDVIRLIEK